MVQLQLSFGDSLLERSLSPATTAMTVDLDLKADFVDVNGDSFTLHFYKAICIPQSAFRGYGACEIVNWFIEWNRMHREC